MPIDIRADTDQLKRIARQLADIPNALPKVVSRSINRVAGQAQSRAVKALASATGMRQKDLRHKKIRLLKASWRKWRARIFFDGSGIPLRQLSPRQTAEGVTYRLAGKRQLMQSAFIATMPDNHRGVFIRAPKNKTRTTEIIQHGGRIERVGRLPIFEPRSPSIQQMADRLGLFDTIEDFAAAELARQLDVQAGVLLTQFARRR